MKFVPKGPIYNIPALIQIMGWCRSDSKPLSEPMMVYWCIYVSLGLSELTRLPKPGFLLAGKFDMDFY